MGCSTAKYIASDVECQLCCFLILLLCTIRFSFMVQWSAVLELVDVDFYDEENGTEQSHLSIEHMRGRPASIVLTAVQGASGPDRKMARFSRLD